jgi:hypothetical protein
VPRRHATPRRVRGSRLGETKHRSGSGLRLAEPKLGWAGLAMSPYIAPQYVIWPMLDAHHAFHVDERPVETARYPQSLSSRTATSSRWTSHQPPSEAAPEARAVSGGRRIASAP